jgi:hypothetical protein
MFEDIVIDQQNLLDSPATWGKVLDLVPDANQRVITFSFYLHSFCLGIQRQSTGRH